MKQKQLIMAAWILCSVFALRASASVEGDNLEASVNELKGYVKSICLAPPFWPNENKEISTIQNFVKDRSLSDEAYIEAIEEVAREFLTPRTTANGKILPTNGYGGHSVIFLMGELGSSNFLPWLEKQANESQWAGVRQNAAVSYVKVAGLDATPFVQKILSGSRETYDFHCKYLATKEFFEQIAKAESEKAPQKKIDAAYKMLVEQAQTVAYVGHADEIDKFLCERLQGYRASIQREKIVGRFVDSENEIARANFGKKRDEIQKTPKAERTDLSNRFPGLAEVKLEDEKQTETTKPEEDK